MMWTDAVKSLNAACLDVFQDADVALTRDGTVHTCRCIFSDPHDATAPTGTGSVAVTSYSSSIEVNEFDLGTRPLIDETVTVIRDLAGGEKAPAQDYRIIDVRQDGHGVLTIDLLEVEGGD
jgi:hypothetical protein